MKGLKKLVLCVCMLTLMAMLAACGGEPSGTYTVEIKTENGKPLEEVEVRVYTDTTKSDIVAVGKTDETGTFSFESKGAIGNVIYLDGVPMGYDLSESYEITEQNTQIALKTELLSLDELEGVTFELGDVFADMSVTTPEGKTYTISELLKEKKAVVLNFWYIGCQPCKTEFPYLQEAYEAYQEDIEVIAINPMDGTDETIAAYQKENGLTFPMAVCDAAWATYMGNPSYPTTVVIDRYGTIGFMHTGSVTATEDFTKVFEFFTADDYEQTTIRRLSEIEQ